VPRCNCLDQQSVVGRTMRRPIGWRGALIRTISILSCSTATRIVIGHGCRSCRTGLGGFYNNGSRGARCSATHDRTSHTAYSCSDWPTYDGPSYSSPCCSGQSTIVIGGSYYCRKGKNRSSCKGNNGKSHR
jgi:hypothetical protein